MIVQSISKKWTDVVLSSLAASASIFMSLTVKPHLSSFPFCPSHLKWLFIRTELLWSSTEAACKNVTYTY